MTLTLNAHHFHFASRSFFLVERFAIRADSSSAISPYRSSEGKFVSVIILLLPATAATAATAPTAPSAATTAAIATIAATFTTAATAQLLVLPLLHLLLPSSLVG